GGGGDGAGSGSGEGSARGGTTTASTGSRYTGSFGGSGSIENLIGILRTSILGCGDADVAPVIGPDAAVSDPRARERRLNCTLHLLYVLAGQGDLQVAPGGRGQRPQPVRRQLLLHAGDLLGGERGASGQEPQAGEP